MSMTTKQMKLAIQERVAKVPDNAPEPMLKQMLDLIEELAKADLAQMERMQRFFKNIQEDRELLHRLAQ
jgi:hypothetical protein